MPRTQSKTPGPRKGGRKPQQPAGPIPAYLLSLEVENVRCFGPRQRLDLSDGQGRPAKWTLILGDNGVGKTTLLEVMAAFASIIGTGKAKEGLAGYFVWLAATGFFHRRMEKFFSISLLLGSGARLTEKHQHMAQHAIKADQMALLDVPKIVMDHPGRYT